MKDKKLYDGCCQFLDLSEKSVNYPMSKWPLIYIWIISAYMSTACKCQIMSRPYTRSFMHADPQDDLDPCKTILHAEHRVWMVKRMCSVAHGQAILHIAQPHMLSLHGNISDMLFLEHLWPPSSYKVC